VRLPSEPLRIGWVGRLRCTRSLGLLVDLARQLGPRVKIVLHGVASLTEIPDFHERIQGIENLEFLGRYQAPEDLARIYGDLDLVWAGDFMEAGYNSVWLLPNRLYEGGYYAVPPIAPEGTQTARWITARGIGFTVAEDLGPNLASLIQSLTNDPGRVAVKRSHLLDLPVETFVAPRGELAALIADTLAGAPGSLPPRLDPINSRQRPKAVS
jgi:succinoglycan biosynthesis protein ExoL